MNRAARSIRSGSSSKDSTAGDGVVRRVSSTAAMPSVGSTIVSEGSRTAIALTVKSRRRRSPSRVSPNTTSGLREEGTYASCR